MGEVSIIAKLREELFTFSNKTKCYIVCALCVGNADHIVTKVSLLDISDD